MKKYKLFLIIIFFSNSWAGLFAQEQVVIEELTFNEVIQLAHEQSPDAIMAKHQFRANYWQYRTYKAGFKPNLSLQTTFPEFSRAIKKYQKEDGTYTYVEDNINSSTLNLNLRQNVGFTGGQIFATSNLVRTDVFGDEGSTSFLSTPISIGYSQPVLFYNEYKCKKRLSRLNMKKQKRNTSLIWKMFL